MKLKDIIKFIECEKINVSGEEQITSICLKDSECERGSVYFCLKSGAESIKYVNNAVKKGAVVIITGEKVNNVSVAQLVVKDVRKTLTKFCQLFYDNPQKKLKKIAVVGTNGKTTVCEMIYQILNGAGMPCGKIGTAGASFNDFYLDTHFTTPDPPMLYALMDKMVKMGATTLCMELSAHAIYFGKADFEFDIGVFTNCTQDHLDFFNSFDEYKNVKMKAFERKRCKICVVNGDDISGKEITCFRRGAITYGINDPSDVFAIDIDECKDKTKFLINLFDTLYQVESAQIGLFNVYNMLAASTTCALCGVKTEYIAEKLCNMGAIEGRMEKICNKLNVYIDYAHTPEGIKSALQTLNKIKGDNKLICIFGCGGNRDVSKREIMGRISGEYADFTVITTDNPRFEDENDIIAQIESGTRKVSLNYITIRDRQEAIFYAVQMAKAGDFLLIAGKGAERYQERMGVFKKFSDKEVAIKAINEKYGCV